MKSIFALLFVLCASLTTQASVIRRDATAPAIVAREIADTTYIRMTALPVVLLSSFKWTTGANADIEKRSFLANEAEPSKDEDEN
ncbi:uncharacterized protein BT62DRAFT_1004420 [Guyanagaster necrorhizus]|uniref:Uncharacterized protein n=1 Tax=Guyanagaster necrorhizus TaxID=856835 RepID=A0A9P7VVL0_9AGAR|nr:uncharacterized protein BT62DRAFT_1004420 [Guyanagaster necrorhizus MCA 3950]KAG7447662.1 hypothetical protein BT62DRAFT_1004420 [Guyanagaster necrorhizus MCA 3950]